MRKEIGSEYWDIPVTEKKNNLFPEETKWFISGRSALKAIIDENNFKTVALPFWCCESVITPFLDAGIEVSFYRDRLPNTDAALIMDFFGYVDQLDYSNYHGIKIRDLTHSIFSKRYEDANYYFGSLRKWAGFWTGGFAWGLQKKNIYPNPPSEYIELRRQAMEQKRNYIMNLNFQNDKSFLDTFNKAEEWLDNSKDIYAADVRDIDLAHYLDIDLIRMKRRNNAKILLDAFEDISVFPEIKEDECPMFVPVRITGRDALRKYLIQNMIYCPIHWPVSEKHILTEEEKLFYDEELSLVCDQRYDIEEMYHVVELVQGYLKKGCDSSNVKSI